MPSAAFSRAILLPAVLVAAIAAAGCEPPPPVELGPQGSGGIAAGAAGADQADATDAAASGDAADTTDAGDTVASAPAGGSLLDAGKGATFAARLATDDDRYFQQAELAARNGLVGSTVTWRNPESGTVGTITPLTDRTIEGQDCRDFFITATISGRQHSETATACRSGGDWVPRA
jgi:surface antigen